MLGFRTCFTGSLTTGVDNIAGTAGNDTVNAYVNTTAATAATSTLTASDVVNGGAGVDTLSLTVEGALAGALPVAAISNVEKFLIRDVATAASVYDFAGVNGETAVTANASTNNVTFTNLGAGTVVGVTGNGVVANANVTFAMAAGADAVALALDSVKNGAGAADTVIAATATGKATTATISTSGAASSVDQIILSDEITAASAGATIRDVTITANADLTIGAAGGAADLIGFDVTTGVANSITINGSASKVALNDVAAAVDSIDASAFVGGVTANAAAATLSSFKGGQGADVVTLGALTATGTVDLGAGNDKLLGGVIGAKNIVDGGAGIDSISASLINAANAAAVKNFESLDLSANANLDVELLTGSAITGLTLSGGAGVATVTNVAAGVGLAVTGNNTGTTTVGVKGATAATATADSFTTTFAGEAVPGSTALAPTTIAAGNVVTNGVESLKVVSGGTGFVTNTLAVTDSALQNLTITGDKGLALTFTGTNGTIVTGPTDTVNGVKLIDGSAATGVLNINTTNVNVANAGLTVKAGSANDVITLAQKATVDAGAGNDTIVSAAGGGTFTGGAGNDKFDIKAAIATGATEATAIYATITDIAAGDTIAFNAAGTAFVGAKVALDATVTNLDLALAAASNNTGAGQINWFQYGANTYIVENVDGIAGFAAGDVAIKLSGLVDLSNAAYNATTDILTIA